MTNLIPLDAAIDSLTELSCDDNAHWGAIIDAINAIPTIDHAAIREAALKEAASECQRIAGNTKDFHAYHRRAAGQCAAMILALIGEKK